MTASRQSTGIPDLDEHLGGGLLPGTLTVVVGATGIGKSQLGVHFAHAGVEQEGRGGVFLDLSARGDSHINMMAIIVGLPVSFLCLILCLHNMTLCIITLPFPLMT